MSIFLFTFLMVIIYISTMVVIYNILFNSIKLGDIVMVYIDEEYSEVDVVTYVDKETKTIRTARHGEFTVTDMIKGSISKC